MLVPAKFRWLHGSFHDRDLLYFSYEDLKTVSGVPRWYDERDHNLEQFRVNLTKFVEVCKSKKEEIKKQLDTYARVAKDVNGILIGVGLIAPEFGPALGLTLACIDLGILGYEHAGSSDFENVMHNASQIEDAMNRFPNSGFLVRALEKMKDGSTIIESLSFQVAESDGAGFTIWTAEYKATD